MLFVACFSRTTVANLPHPIYMFSLIIALTQDYNGDFLYKLKIWGGFMVLGSALGAPTQDAPLGLGTAPKVLDAGQMGGGVLRASLGSNPSPTLWITSH